MKDPTVGDDESQLADLMARFEAASLRFHRQVGHAAVAQADGDVTMPQYYILRLAAADECMRASDLAERLSINPSAVTAMVDRLVAKGFVERRRDEEDRRIVHVCPTPAGLEALGRVGRSARDFMRTAFEQLEPVEAETFVETYEKILRSAPSQS
jgi:DNA-binding MarR family transcriptional regulator